MQSKQNVKRAFYVRYVAHPCYLDIIAGQPEIRLDRIEDVSRAHRAKCCQG